MAFSPVINEFTLQGQVPPFDGAIRTWHLDDKDHACIAVKLSVKTGNKDEKGYPEKKLFDIKMFRDTAINFVKFAKPLTYVIIKGYMCPEEPRKNSDGSLVTDSNGKKVYNPMYLVANHWYFQEGQPKQNNDSTSAATTTAAAPAAPAFDPFAGMNAAPVQAAPVAAPAAGIDLGSFQFPF